ncbi:MAG TPA: hypothetical protein DCS09_11120 [Porphyromonadaceae bacterium]|nr:hypothetical protein [Porphyromonadaceae bacterium]
MKGAREYARLFSTGQHGRLYLVSSSHARGATFRVFVLPLGEKAIKNGDCNAPLNHAAVEVFGVVSGQEGWSEEYGWLHSGPWQEDFHAIVDKRRDEINLAKIKETAKKQKDNLANIQRIKELLSTY